MTFYELQSLEINIEDEFLENCIKSMIGDAAKIQDDAVKAVFADKALNKRPREN